MSNEIQNFKLLIRRHLLAQDDIQTEVGSRVLGAHASAPDAQSVQHPSVIVRINSGQSMYNAVLQSVGVDIITYSRNSQDEATRLYDLCFTALQGICLSDSELDMTLLCVEADRPTEGWNKETLAWFALGRFIGNGAG